MQRADQGEQPPRRLEIEPDPAFQPRGQQLRALVVQAAPAHVDRLDARLVAAFGDRLLMAVDDHVVVLDQPAERPERQRHRPHRRVQRVADVEDQPAVAHAEMQREGPARHADGSKRLPPSRSATAWRRSASA